MQDTHTPKPKSAKTDARDKTKDLKEQASTVTDEIKHLGVTGKEAAIAGKDYAIDRVRTARDRATTRAQSMEERVIDYIHDEPLKAMAIAAGVGAVASMWLRRR